MTNTHSKPFTSVGTALVPVSREMLRALRGAAVRPAKPKPPRT